MVAVGIMILLMCFVVPKFKDVFSGMGFPLPGFTLFVLGASELIKNNILATLGITVACVMVFLLIINKTKLGGWFGTSSSSRCPRSVRSSAR